MRNFIQPGKVLTMVAPVGGVVSGNFYKFGAIFGVAATSAAEGKAFELSTGEVYELPKTSAEAWVTGDVIYATPLGIMTTASSGNTKVGVAVQAAANPSGSGLVRLNDNF
jgi:predicted RecA/RadA family phage recombinase